MVHFANAHDERVYRDYFCPHGCSPKQFEYILKRARTIRLNAGDVLVREGTPLKRVFLVTRGETRAHHLGRRLTAVSFGGGNDYQAAAAAQGGGGAWVGEMAFLEQYWLKEKRHAPAEVVSSEAASSITRRPFGRRRRLPAERAMYTICAVQDNTTVLAWKHSEMEALMAKSSDLRETLTRAMTAAIVGKVVAFTASKKAAQQANQRWWERWGFLPQRRQSSDRTADVFPPPPITWVEDEEDEPQKVKIDRKPTFVLPES